MILSRAVEHLKRQHWTGVFIELVIVIQSGLAMIRSGFVERVSGCHKSPALDRSPGMLVVPHFEIPFALSVGPKGRSRRGAGVSTSPAARATLNANGTNFKLRHYEELRGEKTRGAPMTTEQSSP